MTRRSRPIVGIFRATANRLLLSALLRVVCTNQASGDWPGGAGARKLRAATPEASAPCSKKTPPGPGNRLKCWRCFLAFTRYFFFGSVRILWIVLRVTSGNVTGAFGKFLYLSGWSFSPLSFCLPLSLSLFAIFSPPFCVSFNPLLRGPSRTMPGLRTFA